jgi:IstB-like ATP binding protein
MSTATKARVDTAYQRLREHLAYLGLATASEELAPTLERARALQLSAVEVLEDLMAKEAEATRARRLAGRLRFAHYPLRKTLADFDFGYQPSIDRKVLSELSALRFVEERRNVLLLGPPGVGKTHLGQGREHVEHELAAGVVVSIASCRLRNPTPRSARLVTVSIRWRSDRPSRSSFQTTRVSPGRSWSRTCSSTGRSLRAPLAVSVNTR